MHGSRRALALPGAAVVSAGLLLAACSSPPPSAKASGSAPTTIQANAAESAVNKPTKVQFGSGSIAQSDPTTTVPLDLGRAIQPGFGAGVNIIITSSGCMPQTLEANVTSPVVWTNLSGKPQRVVFQNFPVDSGTIPVGGTFSWSSGNAITFGYKLYPSGEECKLAMNQANP